MLELIVTCALRHTHGLECRGKWRDVEPEDKDLKRYCSWLASTDGQGTGLARDDPL